MQEAGRNKDDCQKKLFDAINGARATKEEWAQALAKTGPEGGMAAEAIVYEQEKDKLKRVASRLEVADMNQEKKAGQIRGKPEFHGQSQPRSHK